MRRKPYFVLVIYSQNEKLKSKTAEIKFFLTFLKAIIRPKFKRTFHITLHGFKRVAKNIEG
jgi:hypothetical protein